MTLTKEWLMKTIAELEEERDAIPGAVNEDAAMALAAMKMALASLTAEPVAWRWNYGGSTNFRFQDSEPRAGDNQKCLRVIQALYTAPPAPVSVPDKATLQSMRAMFCQLDDSECAMAADVWNACRAAMLQGAAGNSPAIPDGWVACSERMPTIGVPVITCCGDVVQYAVYAWDGKVWQDWYEEYDKLPSDTFTHWHPRPAAPQQEAE